MFKLKNVGLGFAVCATVILASCENTVEKYVDNIKIDFNHQVSFEYTTTFSQNLEANIEGSFQIGNYGFLKFFKDSQNRLNIGIGAQFGVFSDPGLTAAQALPNGTIFPAIVTRPLRQWMLRDASPHYRIFAYFEELNLPTRLVGIAVEFGSINHTFPEVALTQNFYKDSKKVAAFTVYGPRTENGQTRPGGIFIIGDTKVVINGPPSTSSLAVTGRDASNYQDEASLQKLTQQFKEALAQEGFVLK